MSEWATGFEGSDAPEYEPDERYDEDYYDEPPWPEPEYDPYFDEGY